MTSKHETPASLTPDQVKAFEDVLETLNSPGWKHLSDRLRADIAVVADVRNCTNLDAAKSAVGVLEAILRWPDTWGALYDGLRAGEVEIDEQDPPFRP